MRDTYGVDSRLGAEERPKRPYAVVGSYYHIQVQNSNDTSEYNVAVDWRGNAYNWSVIRKSLRQKYHRKYGKMEVGLYQRVHNDSAEEYVRAGMTLNYTGTTDTIHKNESRIKELNKRFKERILQINGVKQVEIQRGVPRVTVVATPEAICTLEKLPEVQPYMYHIDPGGGGGDG